MDRGNQCLISVRRHSSGRSLPLQIGEGKLLLARSVDEVADFFQGAVVQFDSEKPGVVACADVVFEVLENSAGEIGLSAEQADQSSAVSWIFVVTRKPA
jgi:hypothetical protein